MRATCNSTLGSLQGKQDFQRKNRLNSNKFKNILLTSQKWPSRNVRIRDQHMSFKQPDRKIMS